MSKLISYKNRKIDKISDEDYNKYKMVMLKLRELGIKTIVESSYNSRDFF